MLRKTLVLSALLCLALFGCKKRRPSAFFTEASSQFNTLYAKELDDAFLDPQMAEVEGKLALVPENSLDAEQAHTLRERIHDGVVRMKEQAAARVKTAQLLNAPAPDFAFDNRASSNAAEASPDAGGAAAAHPTAGMTVDEMSRRFGDCFRLAGPIQMEGQGMRDTYVLQEDAFCQGKHPTYSQTLIIADGTRIIGLFPKSMTKPVLPDGGSR